MSSLAELLFINKEYRKLELHFSTSLKNSTDISLFKLYFKYIKQQNKEVDLSQVYDFILKKLTHHWDIFYLVMDYVRYLKAAHIPEDDKITKIRSVFHSMFLAPMTNFKILWKEYENFEMDLNKTTAVKIIGEVSVVYQKTYRLYLLYKNMFDYDMENIQDHFTFDDFYEIVEMEERNIPGYPKELLTERLHFMYAFFCEKFEREETYFLMSEFLIGVNKLNDACELIKKGIDKVEKSMFLSFYYALIADVNIYEDLIKKIIEPAESITLQNCNVDLILINLLTFELKVSGLEKFRAVFKKYLLQEIGPNVYIYVAMTEYFLHNDKAIPFKIYTKALQKYPKCLRLQEQFIRFLLQIGDMVNARAFFENFTKTDNLISMMLFHEMKYGNISDFRNLLTHEPVKKYSETNAVCLNAKEMYFVQFKKNLEFFELKFGNQDVLSSFLDVINSVKGVKYLNINNQVLIDMLKNINVE